MTKERINPRTGRPTRIDPRESYRKKVINRMNKESLVRMAEQFGMELRYKKGKKPKAKPLKTFTVEMECKPRLVKVKAKSEAEARRIAQKRNKGWRAYGVSSYIGSGVTKTSFG